LVETHPRALVRAASHACRWSPAVRVPSSRAASAWNLGFDAAVAPGWRERSTRVTGSVWGPPRVCHYQW